MGWINLAQDRDYWVCCGCGNENAEYFLTVRKPVRISKRSLLHGVIYIVSYVI